MNERAGNYIQQQAGYKAFIPKPLPPNPEIAFDDEMHNLLSKADRTLARLDGVTSVLPNPDLFIAMYVKKEALLSSQIEGTQASLEGVLEFEADMPLKEDINQVREVFNYIQAMNHGMERLKTLPMSLRLIKEIHQTLMDGVRDTDKTPGEFKRSQNWVGPKGAPLNQATYVPPPPDESNAAMGELEKYLYTKDDMPPLIKIALIHSQFETIHPFLDGNGRIGRLLVTYYLFWQGILNKPLLYLSIYLKKHRQEYYDLLMNVRHEGGWEEWVKFFLTGVAETSEEATNTAREIIALKERLFTLLCEKSVSSPHAVRLLNHMFTVPLISSSEIGGQLNLSKETAIQLLNKFEQVGIIKEMTGKKRYKKYLFKEYVDLISRGTEQ
ncbi:Fic family protein [candidate division TA06 bacterium]|uniref:Fic family protein n=1 Tax=candidate division TA06 bacterium TaxID=2250710 RepID=A0A933I7H4_UNCT6|nr:Fic family protein [candidate division TA06 bacterium]